ncbi:hypothetical protein [Tautonia sociabilis]|uniref:Uncharacterized protein n=1 Tax=Tautonia sociabilis TaxID=2080755 RepID=A0A432MID8_9BACT|nr:hypothetical protein [Tautonia sociabilis]RUL86997.1 hypothetical protein TsocGM_14465 [Tautonia sociabilis]
MKSRQYVEHVVKSLPVRPKAPIKQFQRGHAVVQAWDRVSEGGVNYQCFTVSRLAEINGEPDAVPDVYFNDLRDARRALRQLEKWWKAERKRSRPPLWKRLVSLTGL